MNETNSNNSSQDLKIEDILGKFEVSVYTETSNLDSIKSLLK